MGLTTTLLVLLCLSCGHGKGRAPREETAIAAKAQEERPLNTPATYAPPFHCVDQAMDRATPAFEETFRSMGFLEEGESLRLDTHAEQRAQCVEAAPLRDLDGDGVDDLDLTAGCQWNKVWSHAIFLSKGCRFVGLLIDADLQVMETRTGGMADMEATSSLGCAGLNLAWNHYEWNGEEYESVDEAFCYFCEPDPVPGDVEATDAAPNPKVCEKLRPEWK